MTQHLSRIVAFVLSIVVLSTLSTQSADAADVDITDFYGVWVGEAVSRDLKSGTEQQRDVTTTIQKHKRGGFQMDRIAVILVDGLRTVPGVQRRASEQIFKAADHGTFFVEIPKPNPFKKAKEMRAIDGDAVRWAGVEENKLLVQSFTVLDDGRFELQSLVYALDGDRIDITFQRVLDGTVVVDLEGTVVRVE